MSASEAEALASLETLYDAAIGADVPLPPALAALYGPLRLAKPADRPLVIANFVSTLDGVVALTEPGYEGGGAISGFDRHDRAVMGVLRAVSDAVVVGAGTLRSVPRSLWTAEYIYPPLAAEYAALRATLGKSGPPLNVIITAQGELDLTLPVFASGAVPTLIVTTPIGAANLVSRQPPADLRIASGGAPNRVLASHVLAAIRATLPQCETILVEGGPHVMADFFGERLLDELFLTLAPQVAGRDAVHPRSGLVEGALFLPQQPVWGGLASVKRSNSHLFLRYGFARESDKLQ
jgi:riboflavin biosynthesis pyrimidine reductase